MKTKVTNISKLYTWNIHENILDVQYNKELLIENNTILEINDKVGKADNIIDAKNKIVTPGFIDSHTHPIFVGNRANEDETSLSSKSISLSDCPIVKLLT